jgi:hypothetical protein
METSNLPLSQSRRNALVPLALMLGIGSVICSFGISNYWGMALAVATLLITQFGLQGSSRTAWTWSVALGSTGFALGLMAFLMKILLDSLQR